MAVALRVALVLAAGATVACPSRGTPQVTTTTVDHRAGARRGAGGGALARRPPQSPPDRGPPARCGALRAPHPPVTREHVEGGRALRTHGRRWTEDHGRTASGGPAARPPRGGRRHRRC